MEGLANSMTGNGMTGVAPGMTGGAPGMMQNPFGSFGNFRRPMMNPMMFANMMANNNNQSGQSQGQNGNQNQGVNPMQAMIERAFFERTYASQLKEL